MAGSFCSASVICRIGNSRSWITRCKGSALSGVASPDAASPARSGSSNATVSLMSPAIAWHSFSSHPGTPAASAAASPSTR